MKGLKGLGWRLHDHLKEFRPKMFQSLQQQGRLNSYLLDQQQSVQDQLDQLLNAGFHLYEAEEVVREQMFPPSEEDEPVLGEQD